VQLIREGRMKEANKKFGESFTITPYIVHRIIKSISGLNVKSIIAPHEADSQLAYLFKTQKASLIITEDSDLLAFGVTKLLYKMDKEGNGEELDIQAILKDKQFSELPFTDEMFLST
jgi:exonuclease-1